MVIQLEDLNITATIVEIILLTLMARLQSLILTFLLQNASVMKPIFFKYVPKSRGSAIKRETFESRNQNKTM